VPEFNQLSLDKTSHYIQSGSAFHFYVNEFSFVLNLSSGALRSIGGIDMKNIQRVKLLTQM